MKTQTPIHAFALIPNHFHLLLRRGQTEIATVMRKLLTGYASRYNRRHQRSGHLFQNRYKAIVCQDEPYFLELIRYIHLNPIRAGLCPSLKALEGYSFCGHSYLMGKLKAEWFEPDEVLSHFGLSERQARGVYLEFLRNGLSMGKRDDLTGGGLRRSLSCTKGCSATKQAFDDRILGEGSFVESVLANSDRRLPSGQRPDFRDVLSIICEESGLSECSILGQNRSALVSKARAILAYRMENDMGLSPTQIAERLSISVPGALKAIARGRLRANNLSNNGD